MDTFYKDAVTIVQARSNEARDSTAARGTHLRHCYQDVPSGQFIWWMQGLLPCWHHCVKIKVH